MSRISNYPHLIGVSENEKKELHGVSEVADFICDQGRFGDLRVFTPDGEEVLNKWIVAAIFVRYFVKHILYNRKLFGFDAYKAILTQRV